MKMSIYVLCILALAAPALWANSASQTDWSGGPGIPGPVTTWGNRFNVATDLDWDTTPGQLKLVIDMGENPITTGFDGAAHLFVCDFDNDGDMDVVGVARFENSISWWENEGGGDSFTEHAIGSVLEPMFVASADLDRDGDRDVLVSGGTNDEIIFFENRTGGTSWLSHILESDFDAREIRCADFDNDGDADVVGVSYSTGDVAWWQNRLSSGLPWIKSYIDGSLIGAYACNTADIDNDNDLDVVATSYSQDKIILYRNDLNFTGSWIKETVATGVGGPVSISAAPMDADGYNEIAVACYNAQRIALYDYSDTSYQWTMRTIDATLSGASCVYTHDFDIDGDLDIAASGEIADDVVWYKNDGTAWNWTKYTISSNFDGASAVSAGDFDGDGVYDIAATAMNGDKISWWRIAGFSTPGVLESSIFDTIDGLTYWQFFYWSLNQPGGTSIVFNLRSSDNAADMGPWSGDLTVSPTSLIGVLSNGDRYVQYRVTLSTTQPYQTPALWDVLIAWAPDGVSEGQEGTQALVLLSDNPCAGAFTLRWTLQQAGNATLLVYDMSGRIVREIENGWFDAGSREATVDGLPAGTYACCLQGDGMLAMQRVVVLN